MVKNQFNVTGDTSFYDTIDQKYQVQTQGARGKVGVWGGGEGGSLMSKITIVSIYC